MNNADKTVLKADTLIQGAGNVVQNADSILGEIEAVFDKIEAGAKYIDQLDLSQGSEFPVCIKKTFGGADYMIAFHSLEVIAGQGTRVNASMKFDIPGSDRTLYFTATPRCPASASRPPNAWCI